MHQSTHPSSLPGALRRRRAIAGGILAGALALCAAQASASVSNPTIGKLLWSEEFNGSSVNTTHWTVSNGNGCEYGLCGFGNQELQWYHPDNVTIQNVPFEPSTRALAITAKRQVIGQQQFTSGKLISQNKVQVKFGMVEVRMSTPNLADGLWPAAWMLGTSMAGWPRSGEIDIMESGHRAAYRTAAGSPSINNFVGSNVIFYHPDACVPGNESCAASTAWQTKNWYVPRNSLVNRFVKYRLYWTDTQMRFTVIDSGVERNMYDAPINIASDALKEPFYLLLNMAVGGNFTDAATPGQVSAPMPATMFVDYVRVYQLDGKGEVKLGNQTQAETGKFGVFTDTTQVTNKLTPGVNADIWIWNQGSVGQGNSSPAEGANVIAWNYFAPNNWFGGSVQSRAVRDLTNFRNGTLKFRIKIPANVSFRIGMQDTYTNQNSVAFPAGTTAYGLVRNGEWGQVSIPVAELAGTRMALQSVMDVFQIFSQDGALPASSFQFAIDDIYYDSTGVVTPPPPPPPPAGSFGATQNGATMLNFHVATSGWADVHYTVNGGGQQNIRMRQDSGVNTYTAGGLKAGDVVNYWFTYWNTTGNYAVDTAQQSFTMK